MLASGVIACTACTGAIWSSPPAAMSPATGLTRSSSPRDRGNALARDYIGKYIRWLDPYSPTRSYFLDRMQLSKPLVRGVGHHLYDAEGAQYLDFLSQYGAVSFGPNHPGLWPALPPARARSPPGVFPPLHPGARRDSARNAPPPPPPRSQV